MSTKQFEKFEVLKGGFVRLLDTMPAERADEAIVDAARVSYGSGTRATSDTRSLIRYLVRHRHTSPLEMVEFKFHVRAPLFVARQWMRHRTGSFNEVSARYSVVNNDAWVPKADDLAVQSETNKQGRGDARPEDAGKIAFRMEDAVRSAEAVYNYALSKGVTRELARTILPVGMWTEFVWKVDLHNLLHFLKLRCDRHAQYEIRVYAEAIAQMVAKVAPHAYEAWVDYSMEARTLSRQEWAAVTRVLDYTQIDTICADMIASGASVREVRELREALEGK